MDTKDRKTEEVRRKGLEQEQIRAISRAVSLGRKLQEDHPEIEEMYRNGKSRSKIAEELHLGLEYQVGDNVARTAVYKALVGYDGNLGGNAYSGLINISEINEIGKDHQRNQGHRVRQIVDQLITPEERKEIAKKSGKKTLEMRLGIHGLTHRERKDAGKIGGDKARDLKLGVHSLTPEERRKICINSLMSQGRTLWVEREETAAYTRFSEVEFAYMLSQFPTYQYQDGGNKGRPINSLIAEKLNEIYHNGKDIRSSMAVAHTLSKFRKKLYK